MLVGLLLVKPDMTDRPQHDARRPPFVIATLGTMGIVIMVVWCARSFGRTVGFAFGINWILIAWAIWLGRILESQSGAWDGLTRFPAAYYSMHPFEVSGKRGPCVGCNGAGARRACFCQRVRFLSRFEEQVSSWQEAVNRVR